MYAVSKLQYLYYKIYLYPYYLQTWLSSNNVSVS